MRKTLLLCLLAAATGVGTWLGQQRVRMPEFAGPTLHIAFIDVGRGESILIQSPEGRAALVDAGGPEDGAAVVDFLRRHGVNRLDLLLLTRPHSDNIGGAMEVLRSIQVDHVLDCGCSYTRDLQRRVLKQISEQRIPYKLACAGQVFYLDNPTAIRIILPEKPLTGTAPDANNNCVVARVSFGEVSALLLSDIEPEEEAQLIANSFGLACDVLKVSHHGSSRNTSNELLRLAKPAYAVVTVDAKRDRSRPDRETIRRLQAAGAVIARTDEDHTVIVATDGTHIRVTSER